MCGIGRSELIMARCEVVGVRNLADEAGVPCTRAAAQQCCHCRIAVFEPRRNLRHVLPCVLCVLPVLSSSGACETCGRGSRQGRETQDCLIMRFTLYPIHWVADPHLDPEPFDQALLPYDITQNVRVESVAGQFRPGTFAPGADQHGNK